MEPDMLKDGQKVAVPASWQAGRDQEAQRRRSVEEWKGYLTAQQRDQLETEGAGTPFRTAIPLAALRAFTDEERELLTAHEEAEYRRFKPLAEARRTQRVAWVKAGGDEADFDAGWEAGGREMTIAEIADGGKFEPSPGQFVSPY